MLYQPKRFEYNNEDEANKPNNLSDQFYKCVKVGLKMILVESNDPAIQEPTQTQVTKKK